MPHSAQIRRMYKIQVAPPTTDMFLFVNVCRPPPPPLFLHFFCSLKFLRLERMRISGTIPTTLGMLSRLESLALNANNLSGSIPTQLGAIQPNCATHPPANSSRKDHKGARTTKTQRPRSRKDRASPPKCVCVCVCVCVRFACCNPWAPLPSCEM